MAKRRPTQKQLEALARGRAKRARQRHSIPESYYQRKLPAHSPRMLPAHETVVYEAEFVTESSPKKSSRKTTKKHTVKVKAKAKRSARPSTPKAKGRGAVADLRSVVRPGMFYYVRKGVVYETAPNRKGGKPGRTFCRRK